MLNNYWNVVKVEAVGDLVSIWVVINFEFQLNLNFDSIAKYSQHYYCDVVFGLGISFWVGFCLQENCREFMIMYDLTNPVVYLGTEHEWLVKSFS